MRSHKAWHIIRTQQCQLLLLATIGIVAVAMVAVGEAVKAVAFFHNVMGRTSFGDKVHILCPQPLDHLTLGMRFDLWFSLYSSLMSRTVKSPIFLSYLQVNKLACHGFMDSKRVGQTKDFITHSTASSMSTSIFVQCPFPQVPSGLSPNGCLHTLWITGENPELRKPNLSYWTVNMPALCSRRQDSIFQGCLLANTLTRQSKTKGTRCFAQKNSQNTTLPRRTVSHNET